MGDADSTQIIIPTQELDEMMDEALNEIDDGLRNMFSLISWLNYRTAVLTAEMVTLQKFRQCFTALNLFVVPMAVSFLIAYGFGSTLNSHSTLHAGLQMMIGLLMIFSGYIGFPVYAFNLWNTYFAGITSDAKSDEGEDFTHDGRFADCYDHDLSLLLPITESSVERLSELGLLLNRRIRDIVRAGIARRDSQQRQVAESTATQTPTNRETSERYNTNESTAKGEKLVDLHSNPSSTEVNGTLAEILRAELFEKAVETDKCGVKVIILNARQDLSVEVEGKSEDSALVETGGEGNGTADDPFQAEEAKLLQLISSTRQRPTIRDILVERPIADGDGMCLKSSFDFDALLAYDR